MREIVLDTETTGLDPRTGDRVVELGCVEIEHLVPTGRTWHSYINPRYAMSEGATRISGLTNDFLKDFPLFDALVDSWLDFVGDAPLVIHNAPFDTGFLNMELERSGRPLLAENRAVCTLKMARQMFPGAPANLDALCRRFEVDNAQRTLHGALLDARLLAEVYMHLKGGRQVTLSFGGGDRPVDGQAEEAQVMVRASCVRAEISEHEREEHRACLQGVTDPLWHRYQSTRISGEAGGG